MKMISAATLMLLAAATGGAGTAQTASGGPRFTCEGHGVSRVAFTAEAAPCCSGQFGCPQLLANTGLVKRKAPNRT